MQRIAGFAALPLFWISLSFTIGVGVGSFWLPAPLMCWLVLGLGLLLALATAFLPRLPGWLSNHRGAAAVAGLCLAAAALGFLRFRDTVPDYSPSDLAWYNDRGRVSVIGVVAQDPDVRDSYTQVRVRVEKLYPEIGAEPLEVEGLLLVYLPRGDWRYGDRLYISGEIYTPPEKEDFSYRAYLARWGIHSYMPYAYADRIESGQGSSIKSWVYAFKQTALEQIYRTLPDPAASLAAGILLGVESGIPEDVETAFQDTGTTHIIAISGFNITIVAGFFTVLFGRLIGPRRGAVAALVGIIVYTFLVGADAPVVRAAIMGGLSLFARQVGRRQQGLNSLALTAGVMLAVNPLLLWDVGFQLSFAATLGLVLYAEPWTNALESWLSGRVSAQTARKLTGPISEYFLLTLAAQLTTLPIIVYHFQRLSWVSLPANLIILPAQPPIMILGGLSVLLGVVWFPLGQLCAYLVWPFLAYTISAVEWFAGPGAAKAVGQIDLIWVAVYYFLLFGITFAYSPTWKQRLPKVKPAVVLTAMLVLTLLVWQAALAAPDGELHVHVLDVGDGAAVLVQTPEGRCLLIGGGSSTLRLSAELGRQLPLFHREIDLLIVPALNKSYTAALPEVVQRFPPHKVVWFGDPESSSSAGQLYSALNRDQIPIRFTTAGSVIDLGGGASLQVVSQTGDGLVLLLTYNNFRMLLPFYQEEPGPGGAGPSQDLISGGVLLLSGGMTADLDYAGLFTAAQPGLVVLSHQAAAQQMPETLPVLSTAEVGRIDLHTDGVMLWVAVERSP